MSEAAEEHSRKRPWVAALLAVVIPGLGHLYIRMWLRAALWFALYFVTIEFLVPDEAFPPEALSVSAFADASGALPLSIALLIVFIGAMNVVDAYLLTKRLNTLSRRRAGVSPASCPHCGKDLDEDLDFCHWCTTPLSTDEPDE